MLCISDKSLVIALWWGLRLFLQSKQWPAEAQQYITHAATGLRTSANPVVLSITLTDAIVLDSFRILSRPTWRFSSAASNIVTPTLPAIPITTGGTVNSPTRLRGTPRTPKYTGAHEASV